MYNVETSNIRLPKIISNIDNPNGFEVLASKPLKAHYRLKQELNILFISRHMSKPWVFYLYNFQAISNLFMTLFLIEKRVFYYLTKNQTSFTLFETLFFHEKYSPPRKKHATNRAPPQIM
jgi:hypothetical protein